MRLPIRVLGGKRKLVKAAGDHVHKRLPERMEADSRRRHRETGKNLIKLLSGGSGTSTRRTLKVQLDVSGRVFERVLKALVDAEIVEVQGTGEEAWISIHKDKMEE